MMTEPELNAKDEAGSSEKDASPKDTEDELEEYQRTKRPLKTENPHRNGPMPINEQIGTPSSSYGTLDSDCEQLDWEKNRKSERKGLNAIVGQMLNISVVERDPEDRTKDDEKLACSRNMIKYFSKLGKDEDDSTLIDLMSIKNHLKNGADINFPDKHGQTILHEVARGWHIDVARFLLERGSNVNKSDKYGRCPLHIAAAVDYEEMVDFLIKNGAEANKKTHHEKQTPMHYAAKNNAIHAMKVLLKLGGEISSRDYKQRTPLFVAAETKCAVSARFLLEQGAPCGVYDTSGTPLLTVLCEKIPQIAEDALEQFHVLDRAFRTRYYYLGRLEQQFGSLNGSSTRSSTKSDRSRKVSEITRLAYNRKKRGSASLEGARKSISKNLLGVKTKKPKSARTPLQVIAENDLADLIMHPVMLRLLRIKWNLFGKRGAIKMFALNFLYTFNWTVLGLLIPGEGISYIPVSDHWWRIIMEVLGIVLILYFIFQEITQIRSLERVHHSTVAQRIEYIEKDLQFCHPRWKEEEIFVRAEIQSIKAYQRTYFRDPWNIFEWFTYLVVVFLILTRILALASDGVTAHRIHVRVYAISLIIIWLRLMRSCRGFQSLGPFIAVLGSVIYDTMRFAFLFFEFFIPYTVGFWIIFGDGHGDHMFMGNTTRGYHVDPDHDHDPNNHDWNHFHDRIFTTWSMTLMGEFQFGDLIAFDRNMAQLFCGTYFALVTVVCMNLYIALLSDTFARVYMVAQATATMQQAKTVMMLESHLSEDMRSKVAQHLHDHCSPEEVYARDDSCAMKETDNRLEKMARALMNRLAEIEEQIQNIQPKPPTPIVQKSDRTPEILKSIKDQSVICEKMETRVNTVIEEVDDIKSILSSLLKSSCNCSIAEDVGTIKGLISSHAKLDCSCSESLSENVDSLKSLLRSRGVSSRKSRAPSQRRTGKAKLGLLKKRSQSTNDLDQ